MLSEFTEAPISKFKRYALITLGLLVVGSGYYLYTWGLWNYVMSISGTVTPSPNAHRSDDTFFKADHPKGTVLLLHGLNFDATGMHPLAQVFLNQGYSVLVPRLVGHRGRIEETLNIPTQFWIGQVDEWEVTLEKPLICAGYSMGGLLVTERQIHGALKCDKIILFAPALALRSPNFFAQFLRNMTPSSFTVPSGIPNKYVHFDHPGVGPTFALTQILESLNKQLEEKDDLNLPPGLVFVDPRDKVIGPLKVKNLLSRRFSNWKVVDLQALDLEENHAFHLIVDEPHLGTQQWEQVTAEIGDFLKH